MYLVYNIAGGLIYKGKSLQKAMDFAMGFRAEHYIITARGKRPVAKYHGIPRLGEFGEDYDSFLDRLEKAEPPQEDNMNRDEQYIDAVLAKVKALWMQHPWFRLGILLHIFSHDKTSGPVAYLDDCHFFDDQAEYEKLVRHIDGKGENA